uniref:Thiamine transporter 2 n=1 Tax=Angiostrongylus cantonensis TaxID=6313 RepID=A0A0K0DJ51_ANGCA
MRWQVTTILLCTYGFLKEFRPSEPYLYEYEHVTLNISEHVLTSQVYPLWTYSYMLSLIPVFLIADLILHKSMIIFESLSYIAVWVILVFCSSVLSQQIVEVFYGFATATEIAYFAYIYVKVSKEEFKKVTTYVRGALLLGRFSSYAIGQLLILLKWSTYWSLNIISLVFLCLSLIFAASIPSVSWKMAYEKKIFLELREGTKSVDNAPTYKKFAILHFKTLTEELRKVYGNTFIMKWSMWWALATCAYFQVGNYVQTLWGAVIDVSDVDVYNGLTEALCPLVALPAVLLTRHLAVDWSEWGELCLAACSFIDCAILLLMSQTDNLIIMYIGYILYHLLYETVITIAQFNLACALENDSYGLIFGMNTFVALVLQAVLTLIVTSPAGLALTIRPQVF